MRRFTTIGAGVALAALLALSLSPAANADDISYYISVPSTGLSGFTGPYATVSVNLTDATHATVTFDSLTNGGYLYLLGGNSAADVNVNASGFTVGSLSASNSVAGFSVGTPSDGGSGTVDGFGTLNENINMSDGFTSSATEISFVLTNTAGTWASDSSVLTPNTSGYIAAIHGFACATPCTTTEGAATTGYAANGGIVPEPSSLLLIGLGLAAMFGAVYYRRRDEFGDVA